jgi:hypothetical protein
MKSAAGTKLTSVGTYEKKRLPALVLSQILNDKICIVPKEFHNKKWGFRRYNPTL